MKFKSEKFINEGLVSSTLDATKATVDVALTGKHIMFGKNINEPSMVDLMIRNLGKVTRKIHIMGTGCEHIKNQIDKYYCEEQDLKEKLKNFEQVKYKLCSKATGVSKNRCNVELQEEITNLKERIILKRSKIERYESDNTKYKKAQQRDIGTYYGNEYEY